MMTSTLLFFSWISITLSLIVLQPLIVPFIAHGKLVQRHNSRFYVSKSIAFRHFYIFGLSITAILAFKYPLDLTSVLYSFHLIKRLIEEIITCHGSHSKVHVLAYLFGLSFYFLSPQTTFTTSAERTILSTCIGIILFLTASTVQSLSHHILRRHKSRSDESAMYRQPPNHPLFHRKWAFTPHYVAEVLLYLALAITKPNATT